MMSKVRVFTVFIGVGLSVLSSFSIGASFDCAKSSTLVEHTICTNRQLSDLDSSISTAYKNALKNPSSKNEIKTKQRSWLLRRNSCQDISCLKFLYISRLAELNEESTGQNILRSDYQRLALKEGISIEVPSHWLVHSDVEKKNFADTAESHMRDAGIDSDTTENKSRLLAVSALPAPSGAKIRVNVIRPLGFSGAELRSMTAQDLKDIKADFSSGAAKSSSAIGMELLSVETPKIVLINNSTAIMFEYRRSDLHEPSPWKVRVYRIPVGDKQIEFTLSFRESDAAIFKPIIEHTKQSLRF